MMLSPVLLALTAPLSEHGVVRKQLRLVDELGAAHSTAPCPTHSKTHTNAKATLLILQVLATSARWCGQMSFA